MSTARKRSKFDGMLKPDEEKLFPSHRWRNQLFDYSKAASLKDIITDEFVDSLGIESSHMDYGGGANNRGKMRKRMAARGIFALFIRELIDRCIEENIKFVSPDFVHPFVIYIKEKRKKQVDHILKRKKTYSQVNVIKSDGKMYEFALRIPSCHKYKKRDIRISRVDYLRIVDHVNKGKRYFTI